MYNQHWYTCQSRVIRYADDLWLAVSKGKLNESAVEGLIKSYLQQPAYFPEWRDKLLQVAMDRRVR